MRDDSVKQLRRQVLVEGLIDWVSLSLLVGMAEALEPEADEQRVRRIVLGTIEELLSEGLVVVGSLDTDLSGVTPWSGDRSDAIARIESEFVSLRDSPSRAMDGWLQNTPAGDAAAKALSN